MDSKLESAILKEKAVLQANERLTKPQDHKKIDTVANTVAKSPQMPLISQKGPGEPKNDVLGLKA